MRDYSFGNLISALRIRRGLSQYQLGALVGVSDKAVSKWENGVSKPRMNIILKLAEVLFNYCNSRNIDFPIVSCGICTPKFSATDAPITANVS